MASIKKLGKFNIGKSAQKSKSRASGGKGKKNNKRVEVRFKLTLWKILILIFLFVFFMPFILSLFELGGLNENVDVSQALSDIKEGKVKETVVQDASLVLTYEDESIKTSTKEEGETLADLLDKSDVDPSSVNYSVVDQSLSKAFGELLSILLPLGLMAAFFFFIIRSQSRGAQDVFSFGKSKHKIFAKGKQDVNFSDVAGIDDAKRELVEIVDFLKNPTKYRRIGARTPKGVLLFGPAGVGKTLLARAVAGEASVPFFSIAGSEFMEMLVGVGASRARDLFSQAKAAAPSIIFIDEIDAIGRQRGKGMMGGHDEREQTLNQILVEMDGFSPTDNVIVIAATNRGDLLDPALLRPGRFDRRVTLDMPDRDGREGILEIHARGKKFAPNINWRRVADRTVGFSGADLENMLNEAAIHAARQSKKAIDMDDIEEAATKVKLGPAKQKLQSEEDRRITAYHEAGHAVVTHNLTKMDPVHRISIVARGMSLGHTLIPPAADRSHETKSRMVEQIAAMLGGRAAEEIVFNEMTSGASSDIEMATRLARAMVMDFGMSALGPVDFSPGGEPGTPSWMEIDVISPVVKEQIDSEVSKIILSGHKSAIALLKKHRKDLDAVSDMLMKKETLDKDDFESIVGEKKK